MAKAAHKEKPRFKGWENGLHLLIGEASRSQSKEMWTEGGRGPFLQSTILSVHSSKEACEKSPGVRDGLFLICLLISVGCGIH